MTSEAASGLAVPGAGPHPANLLPEAASLPFGAAARLWWPAGERSQPDAWALFRAELDFADPPAEASLRLYAKDAYRLWVNGVLLGGGPCLSAPPLLYWDAWDLAGRLHAGRNLVAVKVHQVGHTAPEGFRFAGFRAALVATVAGGARTFLDRREAWTCRRSRAHLAGAARNIGWVGYSERYALNAGELGWESPQARPAGFVPPEDGEAVADGWWRPRPIPALVEGQLQPLSVQRQAESLLVDFGNLVTGRPELSGTFTAPGTLQVAYIEALGSGWAAGEGREAMYADEVLGDRGPFAWSPFSPRTFRYLRLSGAATVGQVGLRTEGYPVQALGSFRCSEPLLERIWELCDRTLRLCLADLYLDCPHRDRAQWMDAFVSARAALGLYGVQALTAKCLRQHGLCSLRAGRLLSPSIAGASFLPDYALVQVHFVLWHFHATGDRAILEELLPGIEAILATAAAMTGSDGLLADADREGGFTYLDNTFELNKKGRSAGLNALHLGALRAASEIARHLGRSGLEAAWTARAGALQSAFAAFAHPRQPGCFVDSLPEIRKRYLNLNFSCEFGHWRGSGAAARTFIHAAEGGDLRLECATYAGLGVRCNGGATQSFPRVANWAAQPIYAPTAVVLHLAPGWNEVEFLVEGNPLNWDLYLGLAGGGLPLLSATANAGDRDSFLIRELDWASGQAAGGEQRALARLWTTPELAQSTHGYIGYCHPGVDRNLLARFAASEDHVRAYRSVRVPFFCREPGEPAALERWTLPCNTPWTLFFFLAAQFRQGLGSEALAWIRKAWGGMLERGATTCWEEWGDRASLCHAWGASPAYFFQHEILGVKHEHLWQGILVVRPDLLGLEWAEGRVALGGDGAETIGVSLRRIGAETLVDIEAPPGRRLGLDLSRLVRPRLGRGAELTLVPAEALAAIFDC